LPLETDWTVDDLTILPARCRYELIDGRLDLWDRDSLARLAGLALMAELKAASPPGFRVVARMALERDGLECPTPDIAVLDPDDTVVLVVDVLHPGRHLAEMLGRAMRYSRLSLPACWIFEAADGVGAAVTALRLAESGGFEAEPSTGEVFVTDWPFPMTIDLPLVSERWPQTFEYVGQTDFDADRR
jgi:hypothetical protein